MQVGAQPVLVACSSHLQSPPLCSTSNTPLTQRTLDMSSERLLRVCAEGAFFSWEAVWACGSARFAMRDLPAAAGLACNSTR